MSRRRRGILNFLRSRESMRKSFSVETFGSLRLARSWRWHFVVGEVERVMPVFFEDGLVAGFEFDGAQGLWRN